MHNHQCQCGHNHGQPNAQTHTHSHSHSHGQMPHGMPIQEDVSPDQYFTSLKNKFNNNRVFFWRQVLEGKALGKVFEKYGLDFMRSVSCHTCMLIIGTVEMMVNFDWIPARLKHITSGMLFPLIFLLFFNYNVVVGLNSQNEFLKTLIIITITFYLLVGLRSSSVLRTQKMQQTSKQIFINRPYLRQNPQMVCQVCGVLRVYRAFHCPACQTCVRKHSRHSIIFGRCIGAGNELLALLFFCFLFITLFEILRLFVLTNTYGWLTKIMFSAMNGVFCWMAFCESATLLILNLVYGVTEQELKAWYTQQYLLRIPERQFQNNVDQGFKVNFLNSIMACLGISAFESKNQVLPHPLAFPPVDPAKTNYINWSKANFYLIPHLPCHKNRLQFLQILQREEPKMIEMFKLQMQFREEAIKEAGDESLNEFQIQQKMSMKMQAHMMKNMPQMMQSPSVDQQRTIQLQMLTHMQKQFANDPDLAEKINVIKQELEESKISPIEANMRMRQAQQELMGRRMAKMMKEREKEQGQGKEKKGEEEEAPMVRVADEDL